MNTSVRKLLRRALTPAGAVLVRASGLLVDQTIMYKAAHFIAAEKLQGDYLEFGVYQGASFAFAYRTLEQVYREEAVLTAYNTPKDCQERWQIWQHMRFFAFDSFQGLPELKGTDRLTSDFVKGKFSASRAVFEQRLRQESVPDARVGVVEGWFEDTLNEQTKAALKLDKAAIVYIDCDLYEPARAVLEFITPLLQDGTVIVFDDWYSYRGNPHAGERRASAEWLQAHPEWTLTEFQKEGTWRNSFIANVQHLPD